MLLPLKHWSRSSQIYCDEFVSISLRHFRINLRWTPIFWCSLLCHRMLNRRSGGSHRFVYNIIVWMACLERNDSLQRIWFGAIVRNMQNKSFLTDGAVQWNHDNTVFQCKIGRDTIKKRFCCFREKVRCIRYCLYEATITQFFGELDLIWRFIIHRVPNESRNRSINASICI